MKIDYIKNEGLEYRELIGQGLGRHNDAATGTFEYSQFNLYLLKDEKVVGAAHSYYYWNWAGIDHIWFEDESIFHLLLNETYKRYDTGIKGMYHMDHDPEMIRLFREFGFRSVGAIPDCPKGFESHELIDDSMQVKELEHNYQVAIYTTKEDPYKAFFDEKLNESQLTILDEKIEEAVQFVALDGPVVVGGVIAALGNNYLYISILWVDEKYRKMNIATELMAKVENYAAGKGYGKSFLGTTSFQAKGLYERLGYHVISTIKDYPVNFEKYTMIKTI
ncbi:MULTISPECIES: GNAT family N-acetyltransferase [unclassified Fusibacter]|uniref:GNAT family N-acetyltransferase n=1 Tax=unclassified Fusibacter TaxID=2624464 RepID=UPI0010101716|nr:MULTISPECIES: GNAT family N-acetyltransferase [unclassified Fusibacter]MCK8061564.1 GNAT family N-acetyltransferase [Fusibacter sp. A2]NPE23708.1 GNAT family N-acetyltransferase [Fusibacter sp. A1]RXV58735.1 GNAT family N-acetyltransferase [Fusibacter sp. A1]